MTITNFASGTTTADGSEQFLSSPNVVGEFALALDLSNMAAGDILEVRAYKMVLTGGTQRAFWFQAFYGAQPAINLIALSAFIPNDLTDTNAVRFSIKQTSGTNRAYAWKVYNRDNGANITFINSNAINTGGASGYMPSDVMKWLGGTIPAVNVTGVPKVDVIDWNGTAVSSPATAGIPDVNVKNINNVSASSVTAVNANQGTTQPVNFTGTGASALAKSDMVDVAGAAVSTSSAQIGANIVNIAGSASQGAAGYVGTDQSKITNPTSTVDLSGTTIKNVDNAIANVTLVATTTNLTNAPMSGDFTTAMKTSLNAATPSVTVSDKTGFSLSAAGIQAIWDRLTSALTTVGSIGKLLVDTLDAAISTRTKPSDTQARVTLVDTTTTLTNPVSSVAGAVGSVTGNVGGNVNGSVGSVAGSVAGNVTGSVGSLAAQAKTDVAGAVLNAVAASYDTAGTIGEQINNAGSGGSVPTVQQIVDGVWDEPNADHVDAGSTGSNLSLIKAKTDTLGASTIQVRSVTTDAGTIYLTAGDDYLAVDGRSLDFTFSGMPSFVGASCRISFTGGGGSLVGAAIAGTVLSASNLRFELTHTDTAILTHAKNFEIEVTLSDNSIITPIPVKDGKAVIAQQAG